MDLGRLGGDRQELCQYLKVALQALGAKGASLSAGDFASRWRWAAFPQGWDWGPVISTRFSMQSRVLNAVRIRQ
ncbi:hypothetical protein EGN69_15010 [Pseudomonas monteilii]|nr:hypothetical protein EGN69_15010 [Pseudomonas monteilii]